VQSFEFEKKIGCEKNPEVSTESHDPQRRDFHSCKTRSNRCIGYRLVAFAPTLIFHDAQMRRAKTTPAQSVLMRMTESTKFFYFFLLAHWNYDRSIEMFRLINGPE
jgi:hypothetical protein